MTLLSTLTMSNDKPKNDTLTIPEFVPIFEKVGGLNAEPIDYNLLKNKGSSWNSFVCFDFWSSVWATWDWMYRDMVLDGANWDMQVTYNQELIVWRGATTYKLTKRLSWVSISGNDITIPAWRVCRIQTTYNNSTQFIRLSTTGGSIRYIRGNILDLSSTVPEVTFINASSSDMTMKIQFGTSASDRPIFGIVIDIF